MEIGCSVLPHQVGVPNRSLSFCHAVDKKRRQMDNVASPSESIVINSESSKDDSVSSYEDATGGKENGVEAVSKRPTITLAKHVTLKHFTSIRNSISVDSCDASDSNMENSANAEESINLVENNQINSSDQDPLAHPIVLSESDGEESSDANRTTNQSTSNETSESGRIHVRVPNIDDSSTAATGQGSISLLAENSDMEILSEATSSVMKKQVKVIMHGSKKLSDGTIQPVKVTPEIKDCIVCGKSSLCSNMLDLHGICVYLCSEKCLVENRFDQKTALHRAFHKPVDSNRPVITRKCGECKAAIKSSDPPDSTLSWETMDFCNEDCLKQYQNKLGMQCSYCKQQCQEQSLGKYCVRFGFDIRQFCHSTCLEEYKKGIKVCSFCQVDIPNNQGFIAAISEKQHFKEFCSEDCMESYDKMSNNSPVRLTANTCDVCKKYKLVCMEVVKAGKTSCMCSMVCFNAFKFVNPNPMGFCDMCRKHFDIETCTDLFYTFADDSAISFCSKTCMNAYVIFKRKIVQCNWCKVKKYNFDMIKKIFSNRQVMMLCSFHCFSMWKQSPKRNTCDHCKTFGQIQYHLGMSDGTLRSFCGHECLMKFQLQFKKVPVTPSLARPVDSPATLVYPVTSTNSPVTNKIPQVSVKIPPPKKTVDNSAVILTSSLSGNSVATICAPPSRIGDNSATIPVISSVTSLEPSISDKSLTLSEHPVTVNTPKSMPTRKPVSVLLSKANVAGASQMMFKQQILLVPPPTVPMCNKSTYFCSTPATKSKGVFCRPNAKPESTQTDFDVPKEVDSVADKDDENVGDENVGDENVDDENSNESRTSAKTSTKTEVKEVPVIIPIPLPIYIPVPIPMYSIPTPTPVPIPLPVPLCLPTPHQSLDTILAHIQDLCKKLPGIAAERKKLLEEEGRYSYNPIDIDITNKSSKVKKRGHNLEDEVVEASGGGEDEHRSKKRRIEGSESGGSSSGSGSGNESDGDDSHQRGGDQTPGGGGDGRQPPRDSDDPPSQPSSPPKKCIQYVFGVNAWKKWVIAKNEELVREGSSEFGTELLRLPSDELCESLSLFIVEFRKPSGEPYPADVLYYLVLGIQEYLNENGREDNIFTDPLYNKFTDTFDDVIGKETVLDNAEFLVPRIEEEHLWESHQLGVYSPFSLLLTILFITTKGFYITDIDSHLKLAFSHLMKQWPRGQNSSDKQVTKYASLRYFPPNQPKGDFSRESMSQDCRRKFELIEDRDNALRCPVSLYNYYISKCPETVRNRSDLFYLQPERSYSADSPFWFTSEPLDRIQLTKMFNRLRLVKEISLVLNSGSSSE